MLWRFSQNDLHGGFLLRNICNKVCIRAFEEGRICPSLGRPRCRRGLYSCREGAFSMKCQSTNEFRVSLSANDALIHTGDSLCWDQTQRTKARTDLSGFIEATHAGVSRIIFPRPSICQLLSFLVFSVVVVFLVCDFESKLRQLQKNSWRSESEVYFCGRSDRLLRIALTHCQHAAVAEAEIHQAPAGGSVAWQRNGIRVVE